MESQKKKSNSKLARCAYITFTWLVSSIGRLLRLKKKQFASTNTASITYSCDEITQIQDVQEVINMKLT